MAKTRRREQPASPAPGDWPALAKMLMGPIITLEDWEKSRTHALQLAHALLELAGEHDGAKLIEERIQT